MLRYHAHIISNCTQYHWQSWQNDNNSKKKGNKTFKTPIHKFYESNWSQSIKLGWWLVISHLPFSLHPENWKLSAHFPICFFFFWKILTLFGQKGTRLGIMYRGGIICIYLIGLIIKFGGGMGPPALLEI